MSTYSEISQLAAELAAKIETAIKNDKSVQPHKFIPYRNLQTTIKLLLRAQDFKQTMPPVVEPKLPPVEVEKEVKEEDAHRNVLASNAKKRGGSGNNKNKP